MRAVLALLLLGGCAATAGVRWREPDGRLAPLEVHDLGAARLGEVRADAERRGWSEVLPVGLPGADGVPRPMLGSYAVVGDVVRFTPRFPWAEGLTYGAELRTSGGDERLAFRPVAPVRDAGARSAAFFPTAEEVPENLLRLYVVFSHPMRTGRSLERVELRDELGRPVEGAFLPVWPELWDPTSTRLTLYLDPGRLKRGVGPHETVGPALRAGRSFELWLDPEWPDASGVKLGPQPPKRLVVGTPDRSLDVEALRLGTLPRPGTSEELVVGFAEPLDRYLLERCLELREVGGEPVPGRARVQEGEQGWSFRPHEPWEAGEYTLHLAPELEDLAGNGIGRAFETRPGDGTVERPAGFDVEFRLSASRSAADG